MDSWSGNCPFGPLPLPLPFHVDPWAGLEDHVRPPSLEPLANRAIWKGGVTLNAWQTKYAVRPSGENATAGSPATSKLPVPGTAGSDRKSVVEGKRGDLGGRRIIKKKKKEERGENER